MGAATDKVDLEDDELTHTHEYWPSTSSISISHLDHIMVYPHPQTPCFVVPCKLIFRCARLYAMLL